MTDFFYKPKFNEQSGLCELKNRSSEKTIACILTGF